MLRSSQLYAIAEETVILSNAFDNLQRLHETLTNELVSLSDAVTQETELNNQFYYQGIIDAYQVFCQHLEASLAPVVNLGAPHQIQEPPSDEAEE